MTSPTATLSAYEAEQARLTAAFNRVAPADNWKNPINKILPAITAAEEAELTEAVIHFTGSVPTFTPIRGARVCVRAAGYYMTIGA